MTRHDRGDAVGVGDPAVQDVRPAGRPRSPSSAASTRELAALQIRQAMVGRWFFMIIGTIFSIMPAFVYWLAGTLAANGDPDAPTAGDDRRVHDAPEPAVLPARPAAQRPGRDPGLARAVRPDLRVPRDGPRDRRRARRGRAATATTIRGAVRFRDVSFHYPTGGRAVDPAHDGGRDAPPCDLESSAGARERGDAESRRRARRSTTPPGSRSTAGGRTDDEPAPPFGLERHRLRGAARRAGRAGRSVGRGQDDDDLPDPAPVRRRRRRGRDRRHRRPPDQARVARARSSGS